MIWIKERLPYALLVVLDTGEADSAASPLNAFSYGFWSAILPAFGPGGGSSGRNP